MCVYICLSSSPKVLDLDGIASGVKKSPQAVAY